MSEELFNCSDCKQFFTRDNFYKRVSKKYKFKRSVNYRCKLCLKKWRKNYSEERKKRHLKKYGMTITQKRLKKMNGVIEFQIYNSMTRSGQRAKKRGLDFNLDLDYLMGLYKAQQGLCPLLQVKLSAVPKDRYKVSLDRIIPRKGYIKGNVALISRLANAMKSYSTKEELLTLVKNAQNYMDGHHD